MRLKFKYQASFIWIWFLFSTTCMNKTPRNKQAFWETCIHNCSCMMSNGFACCCFFLVFLASWDSLCWTFTLESCTESFTTAPIPQTVRQDRSGSSTHEYAAAESWFYVAMWTLFALTVTLRRRRERKWPAALQRARSRSWRPVRLATPSSIGTATSCDLSSLPVILWLNAMPQGQGGVRVGTGRGTEQQHPTPLLKRAIEKRSRKGRVQSTTQPCWNNLYFHNSLTVFILDQKIGGGGKKKLC